MSTFKAIVHNGRLTATVDEATELPDGTVLEFIPADVEYDLDEAELAKLDMVLDRSVQDSQAGRTKPASEVIARLRAKG